MRLLAAAHAYTHSAHDRAAGHCDRGVARVYGLDEGRAERRRDLHFNTLGTQRVDQPGVLCCHQVEIRRVAIGPVPAPARIHECAEVRIPGVLADRLEFRPRRAHHRAPQQAHLVVRTERGTPYIRQLLVERRLRGTLHRRLVRVGRCAHPSTTTRIVLSLRSLAPRRLPPCSRVRWM